MCVCVCVCSGLRRQTVTHQRTSVERHPHFSLLLCSVCTCVVAKMRRGENHRLADACSGMYVCVCVCVCVYRCPFSLSLSLDTVAYTRVCDCVYLSPHIYDTRTHRTHTRTHTHTQQNTHHTDANAVCEEYICRHHHTCVQRENTHTHTHRRYPCKKDVFYVPRTAQCTCV